MGTGRGQAKIQTNLRGNISLSSDRLHEEGTYDSSFLLKHILISINLKQIGVNVKELLKKRKDKLMVINKLLLIIIESQDTFHQF